MKSAASPIKFESFSKSFAVNWHTSKMPAVRSINHFLNKFIWNNGLLLTEDQCGLSNAWHVHEDVQHYGLGLTKPINPLHNLESLSCGYACVKCIKIITWCSKIFTSICYACWHLLLIRCLNQAHHYKTIFCKSCPMIPAENVSI